MQNLPADDCDVGLKGLEREKKMTEIKGGCLCGAVCYTADADPTFMANCHCMDCRKSSAAGHMSLFGLPADKVEFTGVMSVYSMTADSGGTVTHSFCPTCGAQMFTSSTNSPDNVHIVAASLDNPDIFSPQVSVYASSATSWDRPKEGIPQFDKMPPRG